MISPRRVSSALNSFIWFFSAQTQAPWLQTGPLHRHWYDDTRARGAAPHRKTIMGKVLLGFILAIVLGFAAFTWLTLHWSYSDGERAGFLQKFSRKGWICKTWEGEMAMVTLPGTVAEKFAFTVRGDDLAKQLSADIGRRVTVHYEQ